MNKKFDFHNITSANETCLVKIFGSAIVNIHSITGIVESEIILTNTGYYVYGKDLSTDYHIYYDSTNYFFYITKTNVSGNSIIIDVNNLYNTGYSINNYNTNFSNTGLNVLNRINYNIPFKKIEISKSSNESYEYTTINGNAQYANFMSLVLISCRNSNGIGYDAIYMISKTNGATSETYTLTKITDAGPSSNFTIAATTTGFTITATVSAKYKILEIATGTGLTM